MNQREFYERIYNYKHGIKEDNDTIQHSAKGDEWDSHKYKDKIYLGSGRYRYIYDDGTESTGYSPLSADDEVRVKQRSQQTANTAQGIGNQISTNRQISQGKAQEAERKAAGTPTEVLKENQRLENIKESDRLIGAIAEAANQPGANIYDIAKRYNVSTDYIKQALSASAEGPVYGGGGTPSKLPTNPEFFVNHDLDIPIATGKAIEAERKTAGTPSTAAQIGSFLKDNIQSPSNKDFANARKEAYDAENKAKAPQPKTSNPIPYKKGDDLAALYGGTGGQVKPNTGTLGSGVASDSAKQTTAPNFAQGLRTNLAQTTLSDSTNIGNKQQPNFNPAVGQSRSNEAIDIGNFLTQNVQNAKNWDAPSGAPYSELQVQSVKTTNNQLTPKAALDNYTSQLKDVYYELNSLGVPDDSIINLIRYAEQQALGTSIIDQLNTYDPKNDNVVFMDGAEQAFDEYSSKVIPALKAYASSLKNNESTSYAQAYANANPTHDVPVSNNSGNSSQVTVNDNVTTWDNVPTQTWENTPDPSYTYVVENGYDPEHISVEAAKELFGVTPKYDDVYEYRIGTNGMLYYKRKSWNE